MYFLSRYTRQSEYSALQLAWVMRRYMYALMIVLYMQYYANGHYNNSNDHQVNEVIDEWCEFLLRQ